MFKIGEFSRISRVPVKTLRYYDEIGLLAPAYIDPFTAYRYYTADQFTRLNRILAFKELGLSLDQISQLLDENLSTDEIRGMLRLKKFEIRQELDTGQGRLARIEVLLRQIEREGIMPDGEVILKKVEPQTILAARELIARVEQMKPWFGAKYGTIYSFMGQHNLKDGACLAIYHHHDTQYRVEDIDSEVAVVIESGHIPSILPEGFQVRQLEGIPTMASIIHKGGFETITSTYAALGQWIASNGYCIAGPSREIYVHMPPDADAATYITEIQYPVEPMEKE